MAESPFPLWAREMSSAGPRPTIGGLLSLALAVLLAVFVWRAAVDAEPVSGPPPAGPAGAERLRLERHGVHSGASYARAVRACKAERAPGGPD
jgi:hypothetical protein